MFQIDSKFTDRNSMSITTSSEYNSVQSKKGKITKFYIYLTDREDTRYNREWRGCGGYCCDGYCRERDLQYEASRPWREPRGRALTRRERRERGRRWATSGGRGGRRGGVFF